MLRELKIVNLALIENLQVHFCEGLVVLTGETGAGKSIVLQSIHLLSGGRADISWVRTGAESASVEALFDCDGTPAIQHILEEHGLEAGSDLVIKRVIATSGKNRFYVNGSMATAKVVAEITENLLDVASQHDHQQLLLPRYHLDFVDAVGGLWPQREKMAAIYGQWVEVTQQYQTLLDREQDKDQRRDFLSFQCQEIEDVALKPGEDRELEAEKLLLKSTDDLNRLGQASAIILSEGVVDGLAQVRKNLEQMAGLDGNLTGLAEEIAGYSYQLEDNARQLVNYLENIPNDPGRLDEITARIDLVQRLKRKYGPELDDVLLHAEKSARELAEMEEMDERLAVLAKKIKELETQVMAGAEALSRSRQQVAATLSISISQELKALCFDDAQFSISFPARESSGILAVGRTGMDRPEFLFSANTGEPVKPLAKVASGGELSRVMLALKCILARQDQVETVIFDEIDAGISGKTAEAVAAKIRELAGHHQVLCITHLPQIAARADEHFLVRKQVSGGRTNTQIDRLEEDQKVQALARMLDGDSVSDKTLAYVAELLKRKK